MTHETHHFGDAVEHRSVPLSIARGARKTCPRCGEGALFDGYVKTRAVCPVCGLDLSGHQADDAPPYLTILIVGHVTIPLALAFKQVFDPPLWQQFSLWIPTVLLATAWLLPVSKGALVGLQWANRMHGFGGGDPEVDFR